MFAECSPTPCASAGRPFVRSARREVKATTLEALAHADVAYDDIVGRLRPDRQLSAAPIAQAILDMRRVRDDVLDFGDALHVERLEVPFPFARDDLTLSMLVGDETLEGRLEYSIDLFDADQAARIAQHFVRSLESSLAAPRAALSELSMLTPSEERLLLIRFIARHRMLRPRSA